jgi:lipoic acid synthetase
MNGVPQRERGDAKTGRLPSRRVIEIKPASTLGKPDWIRVRLSQGPRFHEVKRVLREQRLHTVCEEASCPNIGECFGSGTATFMILGDLCTRRCPFCDVAHGRPQPPDADEPTHLAHTVALLALNHVVITSVDRDDLRDGGAAHFAACIDAVRQRSPKTRIEVLVPDFRGRLAAAPRNSSGCATRRDESQPRDGAAALSRGRDRARTSRIHSSCCANSRHAARNA